MATLRRQAIGVLTQQVEEKRFLFGLIKLRQIRHFFLGAVYLSANGATEEHWLFEVYGSSNVDSARKLAEEMSSTFQVEVTLRLVREEPHDGSYLLYYFSEPH